MVINRKIKLLLYGGGLWFFGEGMFGPLFALFAEKVGGTILDMTWAWATYLIVAGLLYILVGKFTDTYHHKRKIMVLGYALNAKHEDRRNGGFQWGLAGGTAQIITGIAIIIGGLIVNYLSFDVLFITMGIIQVIATITQARILKES